MKLRNKNTGEIIIKHLAIRGNNDFVKTYNSLAELNEDWEDYEEPKGYWFFDSVMNEVNFNKNPLNNDIKNDKEIGNYFETREEAEKAVEKLKAWKRLKDKGFKCSYHSSGYHRGTFTADFIFDEDKLPIMDTFVAKDLDLLFGGEE